MYASDELVQAAPVGHPPGSICSGKDRALMPVFLVVIHTIGCADLVQEMPHSAGFAIAQDDMVSIRQKAIGGDIDQNLGPRHGKYIISPYVPQDEMAAIVGYIEEGEESLEISCIEEQGAVAGSAVRSVVMIRSVARPYKNIHGNDSM